MGVLLPVGTKKGLFLLRGEDVDSGWTVDGPLLPGWSVYHADPSGPGFGLALEPGSEVRVVGAVAGGEPHKWL
jgi:hypothetical protein